MKNCIIIETQLMTIAILLNISIGLVQFSDLSFEFYPYVDKIMFMHFIRISGFILSPQKNVHKKQSVTGFNFRVGGIQSRILFI